MPRKKRDRNQKTLIPVKKKEKEEIWIPEKKKKKKVRWSGYKPNVQGMPTNRDWCDFLNPRWCHYCLNSDNAMDLGLQDEIIAFEKKSKYWRMWRKITHWCQSWYLCHVTGEIKRFNEHCPEFKGRELFTNEAIEKKKYLGPDVGETVVYTEEVLEICKHYNNRNCSFLNKKIEAGTCIGCESR